MSDSIGFAQHELLIVRVSRTRTLHVHCVSDLSPLDMINLSQGNHDATGHKVWMGAYLFVEAIIAKHEFVQSLFRAKHVMELGCGTGVAGLALLLDESGNAPLSIIFTDADPAALELCKQNCLRNLSADDKRYSVARLDWGNVIDNDSNFDTVLATDVLYDVSSLSPILKTASTSLRPNGHLVMAHVPRVCLPGKVKIGTTAAVEDYIFTEANHHSLKLCKVVRPSDLCEVLLEGTTMNFMSFSEMEDVGAAILVFEKVVANVTKRNVAKNLSPAPNALGPVRVSVQSPPEQVDG